MDFGSQDYVLPRVISSCSRFTGWRELQNHGGNGSGAFPGSGAWPTTNLAILVPFTLPFSYPVKRVFVVAGAGGAGHFDLGIYTPGGARIFSTGSVAQSGANTVQYVATDFILSPGRYFMALALDGTANQIYRFNSPNVTSLRIAGLLQAGSAFVLPATIGGSLATLASSYLPVFGLTLDSSGF